MCMPDVQTNNVKAYMHERLKYTAHTSACQCGTLVASANSLHNF